MHFDEQLKAEKDRINRQVEIGRNFLYLNREECMKVGPDMDEILDIVRTTYIAHGKKEYEMPAKIGIHPFSDVFYHAMPAYVPGQMACGMKWVECYPRNPKEYNLPQTSGLLILNEILTGYPMALMDCGWITAMRTPASTAVAAEILHPDAETFGMYGCGVQGVGHVRFIVRTLKNLKKIYLYDIHPEVMDQLIEQVSNEVQIEIVKAKNPAEVAEHCDVLCSATLIQHKNLGVVTPDMVHAGQTLFPCDLNTFFEPSILRNADKYIVDSREEHELFNQVGYFPEGMPDIVAETGEVIAGLKHGRDHKDQFIVCSNIGMAVMDVAVAKVVYDNALADNVGTMMKL